MKQEQILTELKGDLRVLAELLVDAFLESQKTKSATKS